MIAALIVSIVSIIIVVGTATAIYTQNKQQAKKYDDNLNEVVTKTNSAQKYEYEKNKDQEVSLDKLKSDVLVYDRKANKLDTDFSYLKQQQQQQIDGLGKNVSTLQDATAKDVTELRDQNKLQNASINGMYATLSETKDKVKNINDQVQVINGVVVTGEAARQSQINKLQNDYGVITKEQGDIRDTVFNTKNDLTTQNKALSNRFDVLAKNAMDLQTILTNTANSLAALSSSISKYTLKVDADNTYAKTKDMADINNKFSSYVTNTDFTSFKNNLPDYPTRTQMQSLVNSFVTQTQMSDVRTSLSDSQKTVADLQTQLRVMNATYQPLLTSIAQLSQNTTSGTTNITSLNAAMQAVQSNLSTLQTLINDANGALNSFKTEANNKFATKTDLANLSTNLTNQVNTVNASLVSLKNGLQTQDWFKARQYVVAGDNAVVMNSAGKVTATDSLTAGNAASFMNSSGQVRGNTWVAAGVNNNSFMDSSGKVYGSDTVRGKNLVAAGDNNAAWMRNDGYIYGTNWIDGQNVQGRDHVRAGDWAAWMRNDGQIKGNKMLLGDKWLLSGVGDAQANDGWLRFMDKDGKDYYGGIATANTWTRDNSYMNQAYTNNLTTQNVQAQDRVRVASDKAWMRNDGMVRAGESYLAHDNGNTYIRPQKDGGEVNVGDVWAKTVRLGKGDSTIINAGKTFLQDRPLYTRADENHGLQHSGDVDGPRLFGFSGGKLGTTSKDVLKWDKENVTAFGTINQKRRDGQMTHFDYPADGRNYIRGNTSIDGSVYMNGNVIIRTLEDVQQPIGTLAIDKLCNRDKTKCIDFTSDGIRLTNKRGDVFVMQEDGNAVVYNRGAARWASSTSY